MKLSKLPYLAHFGLNQNNKTTLLTSTLKVFLFFHFELKWARYIGCSFVCSSKPVWAELGQAQPGLGLGLKIFDLNDMILMGIWQSTNSSLGPTNKVQQLGLWWYCSIGEAGAWGWAWQYILWCNVVLFFTFYFSIQTRILNSLYKHLRCI